jgi:hypothetical protein
VDFTDWLCDVNTEVVTKIRKKKIRIIKRDLRELEQRGLKTVCNEKLNRGKLIEDLNKGFKAIF